MDFFIPVCAGGDEVCDKPHSDMQMCVALWWGEVGFEQNGCSEYRIIKKNIVHII